MTRIERSIVIEAPVEKVFAFVNDLDNFIKAQPSEMKMEVLSRDEGPQRVGFTVKTRVKIGDQVWEVEVETTEFVENERVSMRQTGGAMKKMLMTDTFEPADGGTKWTAIVEYELPYSLLGKLIDKLKFRKELEKSSDYYVNKMKELIEKE